VNEWWATLPAISHFFYIVAFAATLVLVIMLLLNIIGLSQGDTDVGAVGGHDISGAAGGHLAAHDTGLSWLSVRTLIAFLAGFGWGGVAVWEATGNTALTIISATAIGAAFMFIVFWLMNAIFKLRDSGNIDYANAIGKVATVYIAIPPNREGTGQVQVTVQGRLREVSALTDNEERLAPGAKVVITKQLDASTFIVQPERGE
jgi:hypothetical protein